MSRSERQTDAFTTSTELYFFIEAAAAGVSFSVLNFLSRFRLNLFIVKRKWDFDIFRSSDRFAHSVLKRYFPWGEQHEAMQRMNWIAEKMTDVTLTKTNTSHIKTDARKLLSRHHRLLYINAYTLNLVITNEPLRRALKFALSGEN